MKQLKYGFFKNLFLEEETLLVSNQKEWIMKKKINYKLKLKTEWYC